MKQICDGYNPRVRMGNWFEESFSVPQPSRDQPSKAPRQEEIDIGYIDAHLKLRPLNRISRLQPWNTNNLVDSPQFTNLNTNSTFKENYNLQTNAQFFHTQKPHLYDKVSGAPEKYQSNYMRVNKCTKERSIFNLQNVNEMLNDRLTDEKSFKSQLTQNKHENPKELLQSIYQQDISFNALKHLSEGLEKAGSRESNQHSCKTEPNFRRIRSEITLKNIPLMKTFK